jgi:methylglutaconyl-CoA hydratase
MQQNNSGSIRSTPQGLFTEIEFYHPQSNSMPSGLLNDLAGHIQAAGLDDKGRVIVLRSAGERAFCAGASFDELSQIRDEQKGEAFFNGFAHVINSMRECPKFIIVRVQGKAVGGGVGIISAADYAMAVTGADIKLSELELGIGPFVVGPALERKIGLSAFSQLAIDASSWKTAEWAKNQGLYAEVYSTSSELDKSIQRLTDKLAHSSSAATAEIKKMLWQGTSHWNQLLSERAKISGKLVVSHAAQKAITLFNKA